MNQTVAIPAAQDLPDAPRQPRIPDSPFASFDVRIASEHDAPRLSLLLQQLGSADPRPDPALLAIQLQRPRGDRVTLVAERGERLLGLIGGETPKAAEARRLLEENGSEALHAERFDRFVAGL